MDAYIQTIADALTSLGIDPDASQIPDSGGRSWAIPTQKSVLFLHAIEADGQPLLKFVAPILYMPSQDLLPFYRKLLDLNSELGFVSLAMDRDIVCVENQQALEGLPPSVIVGLLQRTKELADGLADMLVQEFHSARYWRSP